MSVYRTIGPLVFDLKPRWEKSEINTKVLILRKHIVSRVCEQVRRKCVYYGGDYLGENIRNSTTKGSLTIPVVI